MNHKNIIFILVKQLKMKNVLPENVKFIIIELKLKKRNKAIENVEKIMSALKKLGMILGICMINVKYCHRTNNSKIKN